MHKFKMIQGGWAKDGEAGGAGESRESLRQVGRAQDEVRKPKWQRRHY
jgi:hypothetical protein